MVENQNNIENKHGIYVFAFVTLLLLCRFIEPSYATVKMADSYMYNTYDSERLTYDERQTDQIVYDVLKKSVRKRIVNIPLFGFSLIPQGFYSISTLSPLLFEKKILGDGEQFRNNR